MRQYFLGPIKWCLQEDQRGLNQAGHAPVTSTPSHWPPPCSNCSSGVFDLLEMPLFYGITAAQTAPSLQTKTPFLLQPEHRANVGVQELGWLLHVPGQTPPSQPCFCHRHEEKGSKGTPRIIWEWAGEIIGSFNDLYSNAGTGLSLYPEKWEDLWVPNWWYKSEILFIFKATVERITSLLLQSGRW